MSNSSWPHGLQPTRLLRPWDFPGKSTGVGCNCFLRWYCLARCYSLLTHTRSGTLTDMYIYISTYAFYNINQHFVLKILHLCLAKGEISAEYISWFQKYKITDRDFIFLLYFNLDLPGPTNPNPNPNFLRIRRSNAKIWSIIFVAQRATIFKDTWYGA